MNGLSSDLDEIDAIARAASITPEAEILICPPATLIPRAVQIAARRVGVGGQDCRAEICGAFTGDISAEMLKDAGACAVIVGHSERRQYHGETNGIVAAKAQAGWRAGLLSIICIGESEAERQAGGHLGICQDQLADSVPDGATATNSAIAYEPVWAIGTGRTATISDITAMHAHIRACLVRRFGEEGRTIRILYGGSVKPSNAGEILALPDVGGALVGGASLKASEFSSIVGSVLA
jgi:triosephosphate isomerase